MINLNRGTSRNIAIINFSQKDVVLPNGDIMPAGLEFVVDFGVMMRDPDTFEKPFEFNPARFLTDKGY